MKVQVSMSIVMNSSGRPALSFTYDFDERAAFEVEAKGWAEAIVRLKDGRQVPVSFYDPVRLAQDLKNSGGPYLAESGMIVVASVTLDNMERAVKELEAVGYFETLVDVSAVACPCCGHLTQYRYRTLGAKERCGLCPVCFWINNSTQALHPDQEEGPNSVSLTAARENFKALGTSQEIFGRNVRPPRKDEMPQ